MIDSIARRLWPFSRLAAWQSQIDGDAKQLRKDIRSLLARVSDLERELADTSLRAARGERAAQQIHLTAALDEAQRRQLGDLPRLLDEPRVRAHVERAIEAAPLRTDPFEHVVVSPLLPDDVYQLVLSARPPEAFFDPRDPAKQDLRMPLAFGPRLMTEVWRFFDQTLAMQIIRPALLKKFAAPLRRHIEEVFGPGMHEAVLQLPPARTSGRLALRRPGYSLAPHRDPKHSMLTALAYLAAPGENESYGTQLYRVDGDGEADYKQTYFPEQDGRRCELVATVPFTPNTMLAFLNSRGAHGAHIPADAAPTDRYTFQFYIAPETEALRELRRTLPRERRAKWADKAQARDY